MIKRNKRGWIRIVEAFVAILLVTGVLLILINKEYIGKKDISSKVYKVQLSILREIQSDTGLRKSILETTAPMEWDNENFPPDVKNKIIERMPNYLDCRVMICMMDEICMLDEYIGKDVYAQSVGITVILTQEEEFDPKQLKLFCWTR